MTTNSDSLYTPNNLSEALKLFSDTSFAPFAGGTDLMVHANSSQFQQRRFVALWKIKELQHIEFNRNQNTLNIGACVTYSQIMKSPEIAKWFPMLTEAARLTGAPAIQNAGTIGGNIANGSPAADTPPALLAYNASIELISEKGTRIVPFEKFHTAYKKNILQAGEIIKSIFLPIPTSPAHLHYYRKVGTRDAQAISKVVLAATYCAEQQIKYFGIAVGSMGPTPIRLAQIETLMTSKPLSEITREKMSAVVQASLSPITDDRSTRAYRYEVTTNLLMDFKDKCLRVI